MGMRTFEATASCIDGTNVAYCSEGSKFVLGSKVTDDPAFDMCPVDLLMAAMAGCVAMTIRTLARVQKIEMTDLAVTAHGERSDGAKTRALEKVIMTVSLSSSAPKQVIDELVAEAEKTCTVCSTVRCTPAFETRVCLK